MHSDGCTGTPSSMGSTSTKWSWRGTQRAAISPSPSASSLNRPGLDRQCPGDRNRTWSTGTRSTDELKVAAVVNWYGIADVVGLAQGAPGVSGNFTEAWLGSRPDRIEVAARVSPMTYIRADLPPVITIHGDADPIVPYDHGVRLHEALDGVGVPNELVTV